MTGAAAATRSIRDLALADLAGLKARHPEAFAGSPGRRALAIAIVAGMAGLALFAMIWFDFSPLRIWIGLHRLGDFAVMMFPPSAGGRFQAFLTALGETLAIAFLGTLAGAAIAFPFAFLAARNVVKSLPLRFAMRRIFDVIRSVDTLIWALMWVSVVGLGPFAGALAIACSDIGAFGKLFSEAIETTEHKAAEGVAASGGSRLHQVRFGLLPQVLPVMASQVLYFFESNTRSATIIGIVGAGGVGQYLTELIRVLDMDQVAFLIIMILITVALIDMVSTRLRMALIGTSMVRR